MIDRKPLRIVHTSDVHLGAFTGREAAPFGLRKELMESTFTRVIDLANESDADALIIAGDFFDNDRIADEVVWFAAEEVQRFKGQTFVIPGNHDPMDAGKIYWRYDMESVAKRMTILRAHMGEIVEPEGLDLVLWGRAYVDSDWHFRPLDGLPERLDQRWHIAMGHGHFVEEGADMGRSLLIPEQQIADAAGHWDYIALGHWEAHADVSKGGTTAVYSGAPMPISDANRRAGGASVVDFNEDGVSWRLHRVDPREV